MTLWHWPDQSLFSSAEPCLVNAGAPFADSRWRNPRFPHGPSVLAFAPDLGGSILNTTGPALRDLARRGQQDRGEEVGARLRPGTEWFVT